MRPTLTKLTLRGYKTFRTLEGFEPGKLSVFIGPNGAGKSNLVSFFRMLSYAMNPGGGLQSFVGLQGGASKLLHDGPGVTPRLSAELEIRTSQGRNEYAFTLAHAAGDTLIYTDEGYRFRRPGHEDRPAPGTGAGHREPNLLRDAEQGNQTARTLSGMLRKLVVHQFHNTSFSSRMRQKWLLTDSRWLKEDGGNLGPFLFRLREQKPQHYSRIAGTLRLCLPFFGDFELEPAGDQILLGWRERESDLVFDASQASDGMLRLMALIALLQQPEEDFPNALIVDEPELGLHPFAIEVLAELLQAASVHTQVIVATQSVSLIDRFDAEDIVVVDRKGRESQLRRLDSEQLKQWLIDYSLSELWEKNVLGGRPSR